jgi:alpha-1,2-mannosyltransferase
MENLYLLILLPLVPLALFIKHLFFPRGTESDRKESFIFFHPFAEAGGGGERVLWVMIHALMTRSPAPHISLYTGGSSLCGDPKYLLNRAQEQFNISFSKASMNGIKIGLLYARDIIHPNYHPFMTLLFQGLASITLGIQLVIREWYIYIFQKGPRACKWVVLDTTGLPFCYPLFWTFGMHVVPYVHYPIISSDMLAKHRERQVDLLKKPNSLSASIRILVSSIKSYYYRLFSYIYRLLGYYTSYAFVNSTWTRNHILDQWGESSAGSTKKLEILYPPVDTSHLTRLATQRSLKRDSRLILSLGQFRPEKNHIFQLEIFKEYLESIPDSKYQLVLAGGCRNAEDLCRVNELQAFIDKYQDVFAGRVKIHINVAYNELLDYLERAEIGLHTMREEHFGIGIVEFMAAGVIAIAHNSGGPRSDILGLVSEVHSRDPTQRRGYLCTTLEEYVSALTEVTTKISESEKQAIVLKSAEFANKFSQDLFSAQFLKALL